METFVLFLTQAKLSSHLFHKLNLFPSPIIPLFPSPSQRKLLFIIHVYRAVASSERTASHLPKILSPTSSHPLPLTLLHLLFNTYRYLKLFMCNWSLLFVDSMFSHLPTLSNFLITPKAVFQSHSHTSAKWGKIWVTWHVHSQLRMNKKMLWLLVSVLVL